MLYQSLLTGTKPYLIGSVNPNGFQIHRHAEIELLYCIEGTFPVSVDQQTYYLKTGDLCVVGSMVSHQILSNPTPCQTLFIMIGPVLLGEYFRSLAENTFSPVYSLAADSPLRLLLEETSDIRNSRTAFSDLHLIGNLYRISALICEQHQNAYTPVRDMKTVMKIEEALTLIFNHYTENITVEDAAAVSGYSKSNFCSAFKRVVGDSFHHVLNQHRVNNACHLLRETAMPIGDIAVSVGFPDSKSFCRTFKQFLQISPGTYRKLKGYS